MRIVWHSISVGPPPDAGPVHRLAGGVEDRLDVVAVDLDPGEAVTLGALDRVDRELELVRSRVGELVVLEDEDRGQAVDPGEVHRLVPLAVGGRALAEEGHRDARLAAHLEGQRHPHRGQRHVGEHRDHPHASEPRIAEVHVAVLAAGHAAGAAHVVAQVAVRGHPANEMSPEVAVQDAHPVSGPEGVGGADRYGFLAAAVIEGARHLPLFVEGEAAFLGGAHHRHEAQKPRAIVARELLPACAERDIASRAHLAERHMSRPFGSGQALGSPPPGLLSRRRDLRGAAPWTQEARDLLSSLCAYRYPILLPSKTGSQITPAAATSTPVGCCRGRARAFRAGHRRRESWHEQRLAEVGRTRPDPGRFRLQHFDRAAGDRRDRARWCRGAGGRLRRPLGDDLRQPRPGGDRRDAHLLASRPQHRARPGDQRGLDQQPAQRDSRSSPPRRRPATAIAAAARSPATSGPSMPRSIAT